MSAWRRRATSPITTSSCRGIDGGAQEAAWRHIAAERRDLAEKRRILDDDAAALAEKERDLWHWEAQLVAAARSEGGPVCQLRQR